MADAQTSPAQSASSSSKMGRDWTLLWATGAFGSVGASISAFAMPLAVFSVTGSALVATVIVTTGMIVGLMVTALGGALVDRSDKRILMLVSNLVRAAAYVTVALSLLETSRWALLITGSAYALACGADALSTPSLTAIIRDIVTPENRVRAASLNQARQGAASMIGPPVAGGILTISRGAPFIFDAIGFLIASVGLFLMKTRTPAAARRDMSYLRAVGQGFRYCARTRPLPRIILFGMFSSFCTVGMLLSINLELTAHGVDTSLVGVMNIAVGIATVVGAMTAGRIAHRYPANRLIPVFGAVTAMALLCLCVPTTNLIWLAGCAALAFLPFPLLTSVVFGYLANTTPREYQGRVSAAGGFSSKAMAPIAPVLVGALMQTGASTLAVRLPLVALACLGLTLITSARRQVSQGIAT